MIVTISRAYGAAAGPVARLTAARLGYRLVDDELDVVVATELGTTAAESASVEDTPAGFGERVLETLGGGVPEIAQPAAPRANFERERAAAVTLAVRALAADGDCVIVGRVAGAILAGRTDLVRVFVTAPLQWRIERVRGSFAVSAETARAEIARVDAARAAYARECYDVDLRDPAAYDLIIDVARYGLSGAAGVIAAAVFAAEEA